MLFQAFMIEILNRFAPATMFFFIMGLASDEGEGRAVVEHKPASVPSIALPTVPHLSVEAAAASIATVIEADKPAPLPPSPRKRLATRQKPERKRAESRPDNVIPFSKRATQGEVLTLLSGGKTQREVAALLEISERTVRRIVAASKTGQVAAITRGQMPAS
jgi:DNA-binding NarL/FixJ family response regulator